MRTRFSATTVRAAALILIAPLMLFGCAAVGTDDRSSIEGDWQLVAGSDADGDFDLGSRTITLTIGVDDSGSGGGSGAGSLSGTAACNTYFAAISGPPESLTISGMGQTEMACFDGDDPNDPDATGSAIMELESRYLAALASVTSGVPGSGVGLILIGPDVSLSFVPAPAG